jgi:Flp pilus assembly protein TadD
VDFGFETLGVLLPFMAILGTVLGRLDPARAQEPVPAPPSPRARWLVFAAAGAGMVVGVLSIAHRSYDDFDALLKKPMTPVARQALVIRAEETHPLDYLYALGDARLVPLKPLPGKPSPRLHALNRALRLCPSCEVIHTEVARNLWRMGLRRQAILEWRTAVDIQPLLFVPMCGELYAEGAKPEDLAAIAAPNGSRLTYVAEFLSAQQRIPDAFVVLDQADALGAPAADSLLMRARLQLQAGRLSEAASTLERVKSAGASDPRLAVLQSQLLISTKGADGADSALAILDGAATRFPTDPGVQRERVALVTRFEKWNAVTRSIEGLERALYQATGSATEAHVASARINGQMGHWTKALDEYRIALAADGRNVPLWIEYARAAERIGHDQTARDAYAQAAGLSPNSPDIASPLHELDVRQARLRSLVHDPPDGIR